VQPGGDSDPRKRPACRGVQARRSTMPFLVTRRSHNFGTNSVGHVLPRASPLFSLPESAGSSCWAGGGGARRGRSKPGTAVGLASYKPYIPDFGFEMPRLTAEQRSADLYRAGINPPEPPGDLDKTATQLWRDIAASKPADQWNPGALELLKPSAPSSWPRAGLVGAGLVE
jgi:hypothetical protein